ncbi:bifunctional diguanylate cyclase/phosphodiesterase [Streptomyces sp. XD-27]|uniref:putative bifunctional diguanylate cyclase/phosphodiesterase n=1 Tax=Streptomyces sp. XD-27 TaxID=3062779 RepID=UPI0026F420E8|nr:EAL domain-containing protein [Streptomyces sp. XD-27]WKX73495.1 EAL domain-containing protein [Streptomyces sp. XD-27]
MTSGTAGRDGRQTADDGPLRRFAAVWNRAVFPATATSTTREEFEEFLLPLARRLQAALRAPSFDTQAAYEVGAALVDAHVTDPDALPQILGTIDTCLVPYCAPDLPLPPEEARARCTRLQHALAAGFVRELRERTRSEQEAISQAALAAASEAEVALHASEARFQAVFEGAAIGVGIADLDGRVLVVNDAVAQMFGGREYFRTSRNVLDWVHPEDAPGVLDLYHELVSGKRDFFRIVKPHPHPDGSVLWTNLTVSLLRDSTGQPQYQLALMEDITEQRLLEERLRYEATHDELTGLPNRTLFLERLDQALAEGAETERFGVCYLDLDDFKTVNDSLGHAVGDQLLIAVAERLAACATSPAEMVARAGGDEFAALIAGPGAATEAAALAHRMLTALAEPVTVAGRELLVRASIGVVEGRAGEIGTAEVMRSADITMYRAKAAGGNRSVLADADSNARVIARHSLTNRLPSALENGEFFIEYQPLVRLADGSVRGAEALVRWLHPVHGVLGPDQFIPLAENTGLIVPLGRWVLEEAARQARAWRENTGRLCGGDQLRVNVNLSPLQLAHKSLVADTVAVLKDAGLCPTALCLEVTESDLIGADEDALRPLRQLSELGVDIALDDFGTGYSNLAYLRRLPVSTLKLDRSFTRGMQRAPADPVDVKIVEGIVSLAHTLDLAVTVEGVETGVQAEHLRMLGCDTAQGWYYARPGPPERLHTLALADAS